MSFAQTVETLIREAMERGEFENLRGQGKPADLESYFETPAELRAAFSILKNAGMVPEQVELLKEMSSLKEALASAVTPQDQRRILSQLSEKQLKYNLLMERGKR